MTTGAKIKLARQKAGLTQRQLADQLGIPFQSISQWERDFRNPKMSTLEKLAACLNVSPSELVGEGYAIIAPNSAVEVEPARVIVLPEHEYKLPLPDGRVITIRVPLLDPALISVWSRLNAKGQSIALERLEELAQIPAYQCQQEPPESAGADGQDVQGFHCAGNQNSY